MFELSNKGLTHAESAEVHDLNSVFSDNLGDEIGLINHKSSSEFHNTLLHCCDALFKVHIMSESIVKD